MFGLQDPVRYTTEDGCHGHVAKTFGNCSNITINHGLTAWNVYHFIAASSQTLVSDFLRKYNTKSDICIWFNTMSVCCPYWGSSETTSCFVTILVVLHDASDEPVALLDTLMSKVASFVWTVTDWNQNGYRLILNNNEKSFQSTNPFAVSCQSSAQ